jgi:hypothetical protein
MSIGSEVAEAEIGQTRNHEPEDSTVSRSALLLMSTPERLRLEITLPFDATAKFECVLF